MDLFAINPPDYLLEDHPNAPRLVNPARNSSGMENHDYINRSKKSQYFHSSTRGDYVDYQQLRQERKLALDEIMKRKMISDARNKALRRMYALDRANTLRICSSNEDVVEEKVSQTYVAVAPTMLPTASKKSPRNVIRKAPITPCEVAKQEEVSKFPSSTAAAVQSMKTIASRRLLIINITVLALNKIKNRIDTASLLSKCLFFPTLILAVRTIQKKFRARQEDKKRIAYEKSLMAISRSVKRFVWKWKHQRKLKAVKTILSFLDTFFIKMPYIFRCIMTYRYKLAKCQRYYRAYSKVTWTRIDSLVQLFHKRGFFPIMHRKYVGLINDLLRSLLVDVLRLLRREYLMKYFHFKLQERSNEHPFRKLNESEVRHFLRSKIEHFDQSIPQILSCVEISKPFFVVYSHSMLPTYFAQINQKLANRVHELETQDYILQKQEEEKRIALELSQQHEVQMQVVNDANRYLYYSSTSKVIPNYARDCKRRVKMAWK